MRKASAAPVAKKVKKVEQVKQFPSMQAALDYIDELRKKKVTGYLNAVWSVRWKE